jgi:GNAT superfamily N-acetyltransferase
MEIAVGTASSETIEQVREACFPSGPPGTMEGCPGGDYELRENGVLVSFLSIERLRYGKRIIMHNVATLPDFRRKGNAQVLIQHVLKEKAATHSCQYLGAIITNHGLLPWYTKQGFRPTIKRKQGQYIRIDLNSIRDPLRLSL